jgi:hypothetical protein
MPDGRQAGSRQWESSWPAIIMIIFIVEILLIHRVGGTSGAQAVLSFSKLGSSQVAVILIV